MIKSLKTKTHILPVMIFFTWVKINSEMSFPYFSRFLVKHILSSKQTGSKYIGTTKIEKNMC